MNYKRLAIDTSKAVFTLCATDQQDRIVLRRDLTRTQFERFARRLPPAEMVLEACGGSHHWGRLLGEMGHQTKLIPPQYVKAFVRRRNKNDQIDARAILEAAARPEMSFVPVKSAARQAAAMVLSVRTLLVKQRTQLVNALRGHAAEFGVVAARNLCHVEALLSKLAQDQGVPEVARAMFAVLGTQIAAVDEQIVALDRQLAAQHAADPLSRRLAQVPGVGPITAQTVLTQVDPGQFTSARHFASWLGLTPKERSTGGKRRFGGISREGNNRLRQLFVLGASAVIQKAKPGRRLASPWLMALLARRPRLVAAVALANKTARIIWAMMKSGEAYRATAPMTA
jgi:transposase